MWVKTIAAAGTPESLTDFAITSITQSGGIATVTTTLAAHRLVTGDQVTIRSATQTEFNGKFAITVTGANTFTYQVPNPSVTTVTGTPVGNVRLLFRKAVLLGYKVLRTTANVGSVYFGVESTNDTQPWELISGGIDVIEAPTGASRDLARVYGDTVNAGDGFVVEIS